MPELRRQRRGRVRPAAAVSRFVMRPGSGKRGHRMTDDEWQEAADAASLALAIDAAWQYGLIEPDPEIDVARCERVLALARSKGFEPRPLAEVLAEPG